MPSASLRNRLKALESAQAVVDDDIYWAAVRDREEPFMETFSKAISGELTLDEWSAWLDANPHPPRGRSLTDQEERQAESAWSEFWEKIEQTRERLLSGAAMGLFDNNHQPMKRDSDAPNTSRDAPRERPNEPAAGEPTPSPPSRPEGGRRSAHSTRQPSDSDDTPPDGPTRAAARKQSRLAQLAG